MSSLFEVELQRKMIWLK